MYRGNKFKNAVGTHLLQALFFETSVDVERPDVLFTLKQEEHEGFPSLHRLYVSLGDASEYILAQTYFDNLAHWKKLCECNWFKPYLEAMREELDLKQRAEALKTIEDISKDTTHKSNYLAAKYIVESGLAPKKDSRGRPSKAKIKEEADKLFQIKDEVDEDYKRIIPVVN